MELQTARQIIDTLAQGIHPVTGEAMPEDSPYNAPPVIRALVAVSQALDAKPQRARREPAPNAGQPWEPQDEARLVTAVQEGVALQDIARQLGRTPFSVESRLVKLGLLAPRPGMRMGAAAQA